MQILQFVSPRGAAGSLRHRLVAAVVAVALLAGCRETLTEVESGIVEAETWPALEIEQTLPGLGDLIWTSRAGPGQTAIVERWEASWDHGTTTGGELREEIYRDLEALSPMVDSTAMRVAAVSLRGALDEVSQFGGSLPPHLAGRIEDAEGFLAEADRASSMEDWAGKGLGTLRAADALRETSPRSAALTLVEAAEDVLGPPPSEVGGEPAGRARARRLAWWSRIAIQREHYPLAIQRGYYACLLLGVRLP